jgi:hypothetical protein
MSFCRAFDFHNHIEFVITQSMILQCPQVAAGLQQVQLPHLPAGEPACGQGLERPALLGIASLQPFFFTMPFFTGSMGW